MCDHRHLDPLVVLKKVRDVYLLLGRLVISSHTWYLGADCTLTGVFNEFSLDLCLGCNATSIHIKPFRKLWLGVSCRQLTTRSHDLLLIRRFLQLFGLLRNNFIYGLQNGCEQVFWVYDSLPWVIGHRQDYLISFVQILHQVLVALFGPEEFHPDI